jgi:hypothetical protein
MYFSQLMETVPPTLQQGAGRSGALFRFYGAIQCALVLGLALVPNVSFATWLTYEMRVDPAGCSAGVSVSADRKSVSARAPGNIVALDIFATVVGANAVATDDGFSSGEGSFTSTGALLGTLRGDPAGTPFTLQNNLHPFSGNSAHSGFQADLDVDGDLDVGSFAKDSNALGSPWFTAESEGSGNVTLGSADGARFLIGHTTFTVGATATVGQQTAVNFIPRVRLTGGNSQKQLHKIKVDGASKTIGGDDPNLAVGTPVIIAIVAPRLTYEVRVNPAESSAGVVVSANGKSATVQAAGDVVALQLFALVQSANADHADDGFLSGQGSFRSENGGLRGDIRGDSAIATPQNNVPPFALSGVAQSGYQVDIDSDGDNDVGSNLTSGAFFEPLLWFNAVSELNGGAVAVRGVGTGSGPTEFLIGKTMFTVKAPAADGAQTSVNFVPRVWNAALPASFIHKFLLDGILQSLPGDSPAITTGAPVQIAVLDTAPLTLAPVTMSSDNANPAYAKVGDTITLAFTSSRAINPPLATIAGQAATVANLGGNDWKASLLVGAATPEGAAAFSIIATAGSMTAAVTGTSDGSGVVVDRTAPVLTFPETQIAEATSAAGAVVNYPPAIADDTAPTTLTYDKASGAVFPLGESTVKVRATDAAGNSSDGSFVVRVQDTTPPVITHVPETVYVKAGATNHGAVPNLIGALKATDNVGVTSITQIPPAGTIVDFGSHTITFIVADATQLTASATTTLIVDDGPALPGRYAGLLADAQGAVHALMELKLTRGQFLTGYLRLEDGRRVRLPGSIVPRPELAETLGLADGSSLVLAFDTFGHVTATLTNGEIVLTTNGTLANADAPAGVPGKYTAFMELGENETPGWIYAGVSPRGTIRLSGRFPNGASFAANQGSIVDRHGDSFVFLTGRKGVHALLAGQVHFADLAESDFAGTLIYNGAPCLINGSKFTPAASGLPAGAYPFELTGAGANISSTVTLLPNNSADVLAPITSFTPRSRPGLFSTGLFYFSFRNPAAPTFRPLKGNGIFHQKLGIGVGQFKAGAEVGRVQLGPIATP